MSEERRAKDRRPGERRTAPRASRPGSRASYAAHAAEGVRPTRHAGEEKRPVRRPGEYGAAEGSGAQARTPRPHSDRPADRRHPMAAQGANGRLHSTGASGASHALHAQAHSGHGSATRGPRPHTAQSGLNARRLALDVLTDVREKGAYASLALGERLRAAHLSPEDRRLATGLVYGTLENQLQIDYALDRLMDHPTREPVQRDILRMGAYQLFYLDRVPDMAAVDESVSLTRAMGLEALTGLVNGVLRNMIRGKNDVVWPKPQDDAVKYLSVMFSAPTALCQMLINAYGEHDAMEILRYRPKDRSVTVRVNYLRCDDARLRSLFADDELEFDPGILPGMYKVHSAGDMTRMRAFQNGLFTIQGESSVLAARMVGAKPGQTVLDACAAPGGKTAVLSEMMGDTGRVYAWDTHAHRVELIRGTMNRLKLENVRPAVKDASVPREDMAMTLDAALVDAPCSGTGVMNEKPDVKYRVTEEGVQALCRTQKDILDAIAPMVKVGGTLVYSTCSILPQENEEQIRAFLERHPEYEIQPMGAELPEKLAAHENALGLQMFAHRDGTDGFYVCRMRRVKA